MKTVCVSHVKDVDGLCSAAIVRAATGAEVILTDYGKVLAALGTISDGAKRVIVCDLGTDAGESDEFVARLASFARRGEAAYVDHHFLPRRVKRSIEGAGVRLVHDTNECSSVLAFQTFRDLLPAEAERLALFGAVTDDMDGAPAASRMMEQTDRGFVLLEATLLSNALSFRGESPGFQESMVSELAKMKQPHEIEGVVEYAVRQLAVSASLSKEVRRKGKRMGRLAFVETSEYSSGNVARWLMGAFGVPVGVAIRKRNGLAEVELRGTSDCRVHLGKTIGPIAFELGGSGGGHRLACGCHVPEGKEMKMLAELSKVV